MRARCTSSGLNSVQILETGAICFFSVQKRGSRAQLIQEGTAVLMVGDKQLPFLFAVDLHFKGDQHAPLSVCSPELRDRLVELNDCVRK